VLFAVLIVSRTVPVPDGVKFPETPLGSPLTLQVTVPLNPRAGVYLAVYVVDFPDVTVRLAGEAETEKSALPAISLAVTPWTNDPLVPVIVIVFVPNGAMIVRTVDPDLLTVGLKNV
jgi:hypothetical protein